MYTHIYITKSKLLLIILVIPEQNPEFFFHVFVFFQRAVKDRQSPSLGSRLNSTVFTPSKTPAIQCHLTLACVEQSKTSVFSRENLA